VNLTRNSRPRSVLDRRGFLKSGMLGGAAALAWHSNAPQGLALGPAPATASAGVRPFELDEITIAELQAGMKSGKFTARSLAERYLKRIEGLDKHGPAVNSVIEVNPDALALAGELDRERQA